MLKDTLINAVGSISNPRKSVTDEDNLKIKFLNKNAINQRFLNILQHSSTYFN